MFVQSACYMIFVKGNYREKIKLNTNLAYPKLKS